MNLAVTIIALFFGADAKVTALESAAVGDYVLIDASDSVGTLSFDVKDPDAELYLASGGKKALITCPKSKRVRYCVTAKDGSGTSVCRDVIDFTGDGAEKPEPAPKPVPVTPPGPAPKLPDGRFKVAQASYDQLMLVSAGQRASDAALIVKQLAKLRDKVTAGEVDPTEIGEIKPAVFAATKELPQDVRKRCNGWGVWWGNAIVTAISGGTLKTKSDWLTFLDETMLGLKAVK